MDAISSIQMVWTVVAFIVFIGIVVWAWSNKRNDEFRDAANLIMDDEKSSPHPDVEEQKHV